MVIEGKLHRKSDTQSVSDTFRKRDFVVEYADNPLYPQFVQFQLTQDRCSLLDNFHEGDKIEVTFNLRGREYADKNTGEMKYFNTLEAWKIQKVEAAEAAPASNSGATVYNMADLDSDDSDDLPF
jgi:translation initiation factor IF-3